jgi:hypothetical protein
VALTRDSRLKASASMNRQEVPTPDNSVSGDSSVLSLHEDKDVHVFTNVMINGKFCCGNVRAVSVHIGKV